MGIKLFQFKQNSQWLITIVTALLTMLAIRFPAVVAQSPAGEVLATTIAWSPTGEYIAVGYDDGRIQFLDVKNEQQIRVIQDIPEVISALAWSPDGQYIASGTWGNNGSLRIWEVQSGELFYETPIFGVTVTTISWNPQGNTIIGITTEGLTAEGNAAIVNLSTKMITLKSFGVTLETQWSPNGQFVAFGTYTGIIVRDSSQFENILEVATNPEITPSGEYATVLKLAWSADSTLVAAALHNRDILVWSLEDPQPFASFTAGNEHIVLTGSPVGGIVQDLQFENGSQTLATITMDGFIRTWNIQEGTLADETRIPASGVAAFSPYGARVAIQDPSDPSNQLDSSVRWMSDDGLAIIVVDPSLTHLAAIADACELPEHVMEQLPNSAAISENSQLLDFVAQLDTLTDEHIPAGCRADLLAIVEAIGAE